MHLTRSEVGLSQILKERVMLLTCFVCKVFFNGGPVFPFLCKSIVVKPVGIRQRGQVYANTLTTEVEKGVAGDQINLPKVCCSPPPAPIGDTKGG